MSVRFHSHNIGFSLKNKIAVKKLILFLIRSERKKAGAINYVFCSDKFLFELNKKFLKHSTLTDIITFQYPYKNLSGEIFISIPRVKENAKKFKVSFDSELRRVMIHGVLHLCGYKDKSQSQKKKIRAKENRYVVSLK